MISAYNAFFAQLGINVKKKPPSIQNIIQRFLIKQTDKPFPKINPLVDAVNIAAVSHLIPLGIFDAACVEGTLQLALSNGGEDFLGIGAESAVTLEQGKLVLVDNVKVLSEFSIRDSQAQMITDKTQEMWLLGCMVPGVEAGSVKNAMDYALTLIQSKSKHKES
jgi:DNA/RNA-binding domain of Phe-tRNA-synthetase-like protein